MRTIDALIGVPTCAALTIHRRRRDGRRNDIDLPQRIAIVKLAEQGATVAAHEALRRAVDLVGSDNVFIVVFAENRFVLDELEVVPPSNVLCIRTTSLTKAARDLLRSLRRLRREGIDTAIDFEFFARASAIITYLSGATRRVGYHSWFGEGSWRGDLMTHRLSFNPRGHASQSFLTLVEAARGPGDRLPALDFLGESAHPCDPPTADIGPEEVAAARRTLEDDAGSAITGPVVLLNANTSDLVPLRMWPADRYVALARCLLDRDPSAHVAFTGAPDEADAIAALVSRVSSPRCSNLAGRTTMHQLLALYAASDVLVTNDSGPAHFATLTDIEVVTLFGPESPAVFGARSPRSHHIWAGLACSPCVHAFNDRQTACTDNICMQAISVEEVADTVSRLLDRRGGTHPSCDRP